MRYTLLLVLLAGSLLAQPPKSKPSAKRPAHPDIGEVTGDCLACHRGTHPVLVADWSASKHGTRDVPCITCHNAVGASFLRKPDSARCVACHSDAVLSLSQPHMKGKDCFSCHAPHSLNPHRRLHHPAPTSKAGK